MKAYEENPVTGMNIAIGVVAVAAAWLLFGPKKKRNSPCPLNAQKLNDWSVDLGKAYFKVTTSGPPPYAVLRKSFPQGVDIPPEQIIVITPDEKFWIYEVSPGVDQAVLDPDIKKSYCEYKKVV